MPEASLPLMVGRVLRAQRACPGSGDLGTLTSCCSVGSSFGDCSVQSEEDEGEFGNCKPSTQASVRTLLRAGAKRKLAEHADTEVDMGYGQLPSLLLFRLSACPVSFSCNLNLNCWRNQ